MPNGLALDNIKLIIVDEHYPSYIYSFLCISYEYELILITLIGLIYLGLTFVQEQVITTAFVNLVNNIPRML